MSFYQKRKLTISHCATHLSIFVLTVAALTIFMQLLAGPHQDLYWKSDYAIFLIDMYHASHLEQQIGISSRFGWAHPGPFNYYMLLPWYWIFDNKEGGLILGTFLYNVGFAAASTWTIAKVSDKNTAVLFLTTAVIYSSVALGARIFLDVLLPYSTLFPWIFAVCISMAIVLKHSYFIPLLALALSCVTQMHIAFWIPAIMLGFSTMVGSFIHKKPEQKEILLWAAAALLFLTSWLPPIQEFNNLRKIFEFFTSRPSADHSILEAGRALAVLMGEPLQGSALSYGETKLGGMPLYVGLLAIMASLICTVAALKTKNKPALALGCLVLVQLVTYVYALSRIAGPILHHSITFVPMISIFIALQALLLVNLRPSKARVKTAAALAGSLATLVFVTTHYQPINNAITAQKTPDEKIADLQRDLTAAIQSCSGTPTIIMNQALWEPVVGAVSGVYREGRTFNITPSFWSIIFGWRVPTSPTNCTVKFIQKNDRIVVNVKDYDGAIATGEVPVISLSALDFMPYGTATFDKESLRVSSEPFTDAGFVSQELTLPPGPYRVKALMEWSATSEKINSNAGHLSFHGKSLIYAINGLAGTDTAITEYFTSDGKSFRLSFGLGGWSTGKGYVKLKSLQIDALKE
ncbi:hypothetical protein SAMN05444064_12643 [Pseudomonas syringae]|uniref:hypothetical protein n=1 Tax=Pseudomonas syringae TaxID=317 RepID=UPI00089D7368|nr:hypothetical protein [Pseudomonas syringae]SDX27378.1 hypothetical protein SAMN05444514_11683 [Pseudomonas syringae]SFM69586.1 hypothetical protein SAMN05444064_12643 [Pseudomonas syringae]